MDLDELLPKKPDDPLVALTRQDLDPFSVEELGARIAVLEAEIARAKARIDRAAMLARNAPRRAEEIGEAYRRLTHPDEMGELFKVMAVTGKHWPEPGGF